MEPYKEEMKRVGSVRNGESQHLPGILEDLPPLSVPLPSEALTAVTDALAQLREVSIPDWLDSAPTNAEVYAALVTIDCWTVLIDMIRGRIIKKAVIG